jgi:hypothetical protein
MAGAAGAQEVQGARQMEEEPQGVVVHRPLVLQKLQQRDASKSFLATIVRAAPGLFARASSI